MRNLLLSLVTLGSLAASGANTPAAAQPLAPTWSGASVQRVQYYEPDWREREEWRRRREIEFRRHEEWRRREEWRAQHGYPPPPPPPGYLPPPYGPRY